MREKLRIILALLFIVSTRPIFSQAISGAKIFEKYNVQLRQSFESADTKQEPAAFTITLPQKSAGSYLIDGGISLGYAFRDSLQHERLYVKVLAEYHRNTLIEKTQNNSQFGIGAQYFLKSPQAVNWIVNGSLKYINDAATDKGSLLLSGGMTYYNETEKWYAINSPTNVARIGTTQLRSFFTPSAGFEYQRTTKVAGDSLYNIKDNVLRGIGKARLSFTLHKFPSMVPLFELYGDGTLRYDFVNQTQASGGWRPYLDTGVRYFFAGQENVSIGLSYVSGENPVSGFQKQRYWLVALKVYI
ncbi:hypothetical protein [Dyadobacter sp. CY356]|uniref:hypothetical protein n=1 Tax=Dyadobacter sp. CY356 TaxID=2906442 RepID=UPI001F161DBD|nr:hypothetical protein [Dyadobacter sp. CY356]MCF0054330.1 hypothetical protein [Dyadobacter sp. CY356]